MNPNSTCTLHIPEPTPTPAPTPEPTLVPTETQPVVTDVVVPG